MIFARNVKERFFSVYNALKEVKEEYVMIHDGARPYITSLDLANLKETLKSEDAAMCLRLLIEIISIWPRPRNVLKVH